MKRIYLFMLLAIGAISSQAQRNLDLTVLHGLSKTSASIPLLKDGDHIIFDGGDGPTTPIKYYPAWWLVNHGATANDTLQPGDSVTIYSPWGTRFVGSGSAIGRLLQHDTSGGLTPVPNNPVQFKPDDTVVSRAESTQWCDSIWGRQGPTSITSMSENASNNKKCNTVILDIWAVSIDRVDFIDGNGLIIFPNPNTGKLNLKYNFGATTDARVVIVDVIGKTVYQKDLKAISGMQDVPVEAGSLAPGMYILKVSAGDREASERFTIR